MINDEMTAENRGASPSAPNADNYHLTTVELQRKPGSVPEIGVLGCVGLVVGLVALALLLPVVAWAMRSPTAVAIAWLATPFAATLLALARACGADLRVFARGLRIAVVAAVVAPIVLGCIALSQGALNSAFHSSHAGWAISGSFAHSILWWAIIALAGIDLTSTGVLLAYAGRVGAVETKLQRVPKPVVFLAAGAVALAGASAFVLGGPAWITRMRDETQLRTEFRAMAAVEDRESSGRDSSTDHLAAGQMLMDEEKWDEARIELARGLARAARPESADIYRLIGGCCINSNRPGVAAACARKSLEIARRLREPLLEGRAYEFIGYVQERHGDTSEALHSYRTAMKASQKNGDSLTTARSMEGIAHVYLGRSSVYSELDGAAWAWRELDSAKLYYRGALRIRLVLGDQYAAAWDYGSLGTVFDRDARAGCVLNCVWWKGSRYHDWQYDPGPGRVSSDDIDALRDSALEFHRHALEISQTIGIEDLEMEQLEAVGVASKGETALSYLERALEMRQTRDDRVGTADLLRELAPVYQSLGDTSRAVAALIKAVQILSSRDLFTEFAVTEDNLEPIFWGISYEIANTKDSLQLICRRIGWDRFLNDCRQNGLTDEEAKQIAGADTASDSESAREDRDTLAFLPAQEHNENRGKSPSAP